MYICSPTDNPHCQSLRRGGRAVDCGGLENRCAGNRTEGSNPSLSASIIFKMHQGLVRRWFYGPFFNFPPQVDSKEFKVYGA